MGNHTTDAGTSHNTGVGSLRVGSDASATGNNATAIGQGSVARDNATSIGQGAFASGNNSVAIGKDSVAGGDNQVSFGTADNTRQLTNVSSGANTITVNTSTGISGGNVVTPVKFADLTNATATNVLTIADAQNMGWVVATPDKGYSAAVKNTNTVNFLGSDGIEVEGKNNATSGVYDVKFRLSEAGRLYLENVTSSTPGSGQAQNTGRVSFDPTNANGFVGAKTVADMINDSGWRTNSTTATGGATEQLISAGEFVNFEAGKNMQVKQEFNASTNTTSYTYSTADQVEFDKVTVGNGTTTTTIDPTGVTAKDGNVTSALTPSGLAIKDAANPNATTTVGIDGTRITGADGKSSANYTLTGTELKDGTNTTTTTAGETKVTAGTNSTTTTAGKTVLTDGTNTTTVSNDGTRITGANNATTDYTLAGVKVSDGANSTTTVGKGGLTVKGTNGTTSVGDNGLTIKDGANSTTLGRDAEGNFTITKDGKDGKDVKVLATTDITGTNNDGKDGKAGTETGSMGSTGLTGQDGLNGKDLSSKVNALRNGEAGTVVYTDEDGNRLVRANDGNYYPANQVNEKGEVIDPTTATKVEKPIASLVNPNGNTTTATTLGNIASNIRDGVADNVIISSANATSGVATLLNATTGLSNAATVGDLQAIAQAGLNFTGDNSGVTVHRPLSSTLSVVGEGSWNGANSAADNLYVEANATTNSLTVKMNQNLSNLTSVVVGNATTGTTITTNGTTVTNGNTSTTTTAGQTVLTDGTNTTTVNNDGTRIKDQNGKEANYTLDGVTITYGNSTTTIGKGGMNITEGNSTTIVGKDGMTVKGANGTTHYGDNGLTIKDGTNSTTLGRDSNGNFNIIKNGDTDNATTIATSEDIKNVGFNLTTAGGSPTKVNNGGTVTFAAGNNMEVTQNGTTITYSVVENPKFSSVQVGNATMTMNATTGAIVFSNTTTNAPVQITGVANGTISANSTDAVNGSQIYALNNGNTINYNATTGAASTTAKDANGNTIMDEKDPTKPKEYTLTTYNVEGKTEFVTNSVVTAIHNMNEQGIKFFHTNDGNVTTIVQDRNGIDSSAKGAYATAIGAQSEANGKQSVALGHKSQANAFQTIAIGTGNIVNGAHSGAIGDPTIVNATSSYSVGNNNRITETSDNTFVLGNNVVVTTNQSVFLGSNVGYVAAPEVDQNGNLVESSAVTTAGKAGLEGQVTGGVYNAYAGGKANEVVGVVSVGNVGVDANGKLVQQTRRIQNVAPGLISEHSTDAVNGSQLYSVASNFNHKLGDLNNKINRSNKEHRAGIAGANAAAGLPQVYAAGKSMLAASAGTYKGQSALAVGYSRASDNGKVGNLTLRINVTRLKTPPKLVEFFISNNCYLVLSF